MPAVLEVTGHAARAVAAVSDLAAVGIEDPIAGRDAVTLRRLEQEDLIAADAEPPIGQPAHLCGVDIDGMGQTIQQHEVVAEAVHLGERDLHVR